MRKVIHDCDNTLGVQGCDVDDGLALLYLLGCRDVEVLGVTTTYGNNKIEVVDPNTRNMLKEIGREDIPVYRGGAHAGDYDSEAASFLAKMAEEYPGELEVLATGSMTNLYGAWEKNPKFFEQVKQIVLMGGITAPLIFAKKQMDELNFSCDPKATCKILTSGAKVATMTGNNCLKVLFTRKEYQERLTDDSKDMVRFIKQKTDYWFDDNWNDYGIEGFYNWDVASAVYMIHPEYFEDKEKEMLISKEDLKTGYLRSGEDTYNCAFAMPDITREEEFRASIYETWMKAKITF